MIVDIYQYLFKNYITYDRLFALNKKAFYERSDAESVDVFIDMHSMVKDIFSISGGLNFTYSNTSVLTSSIINLCAHLRQYYFTRHRVWTVFYIVFGWNSPIESIKRLPEYNAHNIMAINAKTIEKQLVEENTKLLKTLCPYLPDIFFVYGGNYETIVTIGSLISQYGRGAKGIPSIIYTRDSYAYLAVSKLPLTFIFRPKKSNRDDVSYMVSKTNLIDSYLENELKQVPYTSSYDSDKFYEYISYAGLKSKGIRGVLRFKQAIDYYNGRHLYFTSEELSRVEAIAYTVNINQQISMFQTSVEGMQVPSSIINLVSPEDVKQINNLYFQHYPLDLNNL